MPLQRSIPGVAFPPTPPAAFSEHRGGPPCADAMPSRQACASAVVTRKNIDTSAVATRSIEGGWQRNPVGAPVLPREEEIPWPGGLVRASAPFEEQMSLSAWREAGIPWMASLVEDMSSGGGSERPSRVFGSPTRTQRRRMQRQIKKITDRQIVFEGSHGTRTVGMPPGIFLQPALASCRMLL
ncbi:unnamed protein product [Prorocentrum cordatum]|uniref:Uncharacterized protein n=1 Tax=Prorocentrum cordatum TaxID=2364126 RepID=A0ABN9USS1_9DINO|nr:unnamed protein product [Polarella glacialis]